MLHNSYRELLKDIAKEVGFHQSGIAPVGPFPDNERFREWVANGYAGDMSYLTKDVDSRVDITRRRDWVRSVIVLAVDYNTSHPRSTEVPDDPERGWVSRYAWGTDYHDVLEKMLKHYVERLNSVPELRGNHRYYVDHGPILEKVYAKYAGLGWIGKNTMLIHPKRGSYCFLAVVLTDLEISPDTVVTDHCGSCTRCLDICPTDAFVKPYVLDARRCISYWTIEQKGQIPDHIRESIGFHVFGCDLCQDVCPWNRKVLPLGSDEFQPRPGLFHPRLDDFGTMEEDTFRRRFAKSPLKRRKYAGLLWNVRSVQSRQATVNWMRPHKPTQRQ